MVSMDITGDGLTIRFAQGEDVRCSLAEVAHTVDSVVSWTCSGQSSVAYIGFITGTQRTELFWVTMLALATEKQYVLSEPFVCCSMLLLPGTICYCDYGYAGSDICSTRA